MDITQRINTAIEVLTLLFVRGYKKMYKKLMSIFNNIVSMSTPIFHVFLKEDVLLHGIYSIKKIYL